MYYISKYFHNFMQRNVTSGLRFEHLLTVLLSVGHKVVRTRAATNNYFQC